MRRSRRRSSRSALKESLERRKKLERQLDDARKKIKLGAEQFKKLKAASEASPASADGDAVRERDDKIKKLNSALAQWKERMQPLIDKYQKRDTEAIKLEADLAEARERIRDLETALGSTGDAADDAGDNGKKREAEDNVVSLRFKDRDRDGTKQAAPAADEEEAARGGGRWHAGNSI